MIRPPPGYLEAATKREIAEIERRRRLYLGAAQPIDRKRCSDRAFLDHV